MFSIAVTGPRPAKLGWGYDYGEAHWQRLRYIFCEKVAEIANASVMHGGDGIIEMITGMALGVDTVFAMAAIDLINAGFQVRLIAAIPFKGQDKIWPAASRRNYNNILTWAHEIIIVSEGDYSPYKMQKRNEYMVDRCDEIIAVWDGTHDGGTFNCVEYALQKDKQIDYIKPESI